MVEEKRSSSHTLRGIFYKFLKGRDERLLYGKQLQMYETQYFEKRKIANLVPRPLQVFSMLHAEKEGLVRELTCVTPIHVTQHEREIAT